MENLVKIERNTRTIPKHRWRKLENALIFINKSKTASKFTGMRRTSKERPQIFEK